MSNFISKYKAFIFPFFIWLLVGMLALLKIEKGDLVLYFNENRSVIGDFYFVLASAFAEWKVILLILVILISKKAGNAFIVAITWLATGIIAQSLKRFFDLPRPPAYFKDVTLNFITDNIHFAHSFPSGHTSTAFALFFVLTMVTKSKKLHFLYFVLALSTAISRVYLLQHFLIDVYFGSILGMIIALIIFVSINKSNIFGFQKWKDFSIKK